MEGNHAPSVNYSVYCAWSILKIKHQVQTAAFLLLLFIVQYIWDWTWGANYSIFVVVVYSAVYLRLNQCSIFEIEPVQYIWDATGGANYSIYCVTSTVYLKLGIGCSKLQHLFCQHYSIFEIEHKVQTSAFIVCTKD